MQENVTPERSGDTWKQSAMAPAGWRRDRNGVKNYYRQQLQVSRAGRERRAETLQEIRVSEEVRAWLWDECVLGMG